MLGCRKADYDRHQNQSGWECPWQRIRRTNKEESTCRLAWRRQKSGLGEQVQRVEERRQLSNRSLDYSIGRTWLDLETVDFGTCYATTPCPLWIESCAQTER